MSMTATDTDDGLFAIDYVALTVQTTDGVLRFFIDENDGFNNGFGIPGIPVPDGGMLPGPLPIVLPGGGPAPGSTRPSAARTCRESS